MAKKMAQGSETIFRKELWASNNSLAVHLVSDHERFFCVLDFLSNDFSPCTWVVVKIMVPFWIPIIIRHLIFRVPKKGP